MLCVEESQVFSSTIEVLLLAPESYKADPLPQKGKGLVKCVYKLCPAALYSAVQSHDVLPDCSSSNSSLENGERELRHLFRYCKSYKNTLTILLGKRVLTPQQVNSRVHYFISGYVIQLIAFQWDMACIHSSPDPSLLLRKWIGPARLHYITD